MPIITSLLDTDLYKLTMLQVVMHHFPQVQVEYAFKLRQDSIDLRPYADEIRAEIDAYASLRFTEQEMAYLKTIRYLKPGYVDALRDLHLNPADVEISAGEKFALRIHGKWSQTILFEVPVLAIINEVYFRNNHPEAPLRDPAGQERLDTKCAQVNASDVALNIMEFGTRRRYSRAWQWHVIDQLRGRIGSALIGTSNVAAAREFDLKPFGTMAHEYLQAFQAFVALPDFQRMALETWMQEYRGDLGIALSDVVGFDAFLRDFDLLFCKAYDGCRHDSGDPIEWGEKLIAHYQKHGIDPNTKTATFSDSLDIPRTLELARHFRGRIRTYFGIGTNLTNDFSFPALQIVLKMTRCKGQPVAKLSDSPGKAMGGDTLFTSYLREVFKMEEGVGR